jgi:hypothetical protein
VRQSVGIFAIIALLQGFGAAFGVIVCAIVEGAYKINVSKELAASVSTVITIPLELLCYLYAAKMGWIKIE